MKQRKRAAIPGGDLGHIPLSGKLDASETDQSPFDVWLERGLHKIFDDVANEPIPPELLELIEGDRRKAEDSESK